MNIPLYLFYIMYTFPLGILALAVIPRSEIRRLVFWGILYGTIIDFCLIIIVTHLLGGGGYQHYYPFGFMGMPFFPLLAWFFYFVLYLYFLPKTKPWKYIYTVTASIYCTIFSNTLQNLGIFQWNVDRLFLPFLLYLAWNSIVTWSYLKYFENKKMY